MLFAEWNQEDALAVHYAEGLAEGMERGIEKGMERGIEKGMEKGMTEGMEKSQKETAINALAKGLSPELIHSITGLDLETIRSLGAN